LLASFAVPIYEYRCPEGHVFERFQSMTAPAPEACDECGASPVQLVLYPVAVHYKGSGFYTTDYGKGKDSEGTKPSGDTKPKSDSPPASGTGEKKAAASGD
jgi:putative FmdB family regulatory protein